MKHALEYIHRRLKVEENNEYQFTALPLQMSEHNRVAITDVRTQYSGV
jgi:hypothetical protein